MADKSTKYKSVTISLMNARFSKYIIILIVLLLLVIAAAKIGQKPENRIATIETSKGVIRFELYEDKAPITTANFINLTESGFYDGLIFHRVVPGFVIQGGDPRGTGEGGSGVTIPLEIHPKLRHTTGAVGMARSADKNSASSQFYITLAPQPGLDGSYAVFGQVIEGQDVVSQIRQGDYMIKVSIGEK